MCMFGIVFVVVAVFLMVVWIPFVYYLFLAGRIGQASRVSPDGTERTCGAVLYVPKRMSRNLVKLVVTPGSITAYAPFSRNRVYKRGGRGLADATMLGCRIYASQIRDMRAIGIANGVKITDIEGNSVFLYGRGVPPTLSIFGSGPGMSGVTGPLGG